MIEFGFKMTNYFPEGKFVNGVPNFVFAINGTKHIATFGATLLKSW